MVENYLFEKVNYSVAEKLSKINFNQFKDIFNLSTTKRHDDYDLMREYTKLKNYCKCIIKSKNNHKVNYDYSKNKKIGRLQSIEPSIQRLYNGFRGVLCNGIMWDLDMCNCHLVLILNLCKKHNIKYNLLFDYIENREQFLSELMTDYDINRSMAKQVLLKSLNKIELTTKVNNKRVKIKSLFRKFDIELTEISKNLFEIYKDHDRYKKYLTNDWNKEGKYINLVLCDMENEYLQRARNILIDNGIKNKNAVLMFDGFMIYSENRPKEYLLNIIQILNNHFKNENIKWDYKEHNIELLDYINDLVIEDVDFIESMNIIEIIEHILNGILKDRLYKDEYSFYYLNDDKIITNEKMIKSELYKLISKQNYFMFDAYKGKNGDMVNCSKIHKHINNIVDALLNNCESNINFINDIWKFTQFKLFFNNGYFDFKLNKFIECKNNKTFIKINKNYDGISNKEIRKQIYKKILYPVFSIDNKNNDIEQYQLMQYFLYLTSQFIAGNIETKKWMNFQGLRNSGKGVLGDLLKKSFEKYILTTNSGNFKFKSNVGDEQKSLSWLIDYQFTRVALTSEIDICDDMKLNGNMIKKFTSGGDDIMARKNFKDEYEFKIQAGLIIMCNDMPSIQPTDALETCDEFIMKSKFIDKDFPENNKLNGYKYYEKDPFIKSDFLNREEVLNEFILIILEYFDKYREYPENMKKEKLIEMEDEDDMSKLFNLYEYTLDEKDRIDNENLRVDLKGHKINMSLKKMKQMLKTKGVKDYSSNGKRGLCGLKYITYNEEEGEDYL
jgi:hypothetical protein